MDPVRKLDAIQRLLEELRKEYPKIDITQVLYGTDEYRNYIILPLDDTKVSILEDFNNENAAFYVVANVDIAKTVKMKRTGAKQSMNIEHANHPSEEELKTKPYLYDNYIERIVNMTKSRIRATSHPSKQGTLVEKAKSRVDMFKKRQEQTKALQQRKNQVKPQQVKPQKAIP